MAVKNQQTKVASTGANRSGAVPRPARGAAQYANPYAVRYNAGSPAGARTPQPKREKPVPVKKNRRKEREYFFIMRRGVCFVMMLLAIVWVGIFALNYLGIMPKYTSFLVQPDLTPMDEREDVETGEVDADGMAIVESYVDKSAYVSFIDPIFGALKNLVGLEMKDKDGESLSAFYDGTLAQLAPDAVAKDENGEENKEGDGEVVAQAAAETDDKADSGEEANDGSEEEKTDGEEKKEETFPPQVSTAVITEEAREADSMTQIAAMAWQYFPVVLIVGALMAIIIILISFFSLFGRRIYKGFGIMSIIMLLGGVAALIAGMAAMGNYMGNPTMLEDGVTSVIDFSKLVSFLTGAMNGAPATALDPETTAQPLTMVAGYGLLIIVIIPVIMLALSFFARKKVPYSIFDK